MAYRHPALDVAGTIRHDGDGGITDDWETPKGLAAWLDARPELILVPDACPGTAAAVSRPDGVAGPALSVSDPVSSGGPVHRWSGESPERLAELHRRLLGLRRALRALFAHAVRPGPPSRADAADLLAPEAAVDRLNAFAEPTPAVSVLDWPPDGPPRVRRRPVISDPLLLVPSVLAEAAMDFLVSDDRLRLRACQAPRCVRYFVQDDPRQAWCKPSCGNRARVARHYRRHRAE